MTVKSIGVVGAGVMGRGVSIALAVAGRDVVVVDIANDILARAKAQIREDLRAYALLSGDRGRYGADAVLSRIRFTLELDALAEVGFVIENATERWDVKKPIYGRMDAICPADAIFAVNTSAIPITRLAGLTRRAPQVLGMHFMNPVPLKTMVEVIRGYHTSEATLASGLELLREIGKDGIVVNDSSGFVTNRVMMLTVNEAIFLLQDGVASAADIDRLFTQCFGHKMGPLETADLIGLDTVLLSLDVLYENFRDSKYRAAPLLCKLVDAGLVGKKSGEGFFNYSGNRQLGVFK